MVESYCWFYSSLILSVIWTASNGQQVIDLSSDPSIQLFQEYIQINTITGETDLQEAVDFWTARANELGVPINVYEYTKGFPVIVIKIAGLDSSLPSIMLNSHMDIVTFIESEWTHHPLSGDLDEEGVIWGRGTQDMKSVSIQYYEALRRIQLNNITLLRDVYMTLMPDEEVGGKNGMIKFVQSKEFADMNIGFDLDEGGPFPEPSTYVVLYHDKAVWQIQVTCTGDAGHGSTMPNRNDTAIGQCLNFIEYMYALRDKQYELLSKTYSVFDASGYTSINLNEINGGTSTNVLASQVTMVFDIRLATHVNLTKFEEMLNTFASESGDSVTIRYITKNQQSPETIINATNPYFTAISQAAETLNFTLIPVIASGSTDGRYVRIKGIPVLGFSAMSNVTLLAHKADERLNATVFLYGIEVCEEIIKQLANIPAEDTSSDPSVYVIRTTEGVDFDEEY